MKRRVVGYWSLPFLLTAQIAISCMPLPGLRHIRAYSNEELKSGHKNTIIDTDTIKDDYFMGLALSGGGSRAANFSAAVMWELDRLGILEHVQYISAVSGGSLPAAYYSLFRFDKQKWNKEELRRVMSQNFEQAVFMHMLNPLNWPLFFGTGYDRTDILATVFGNQIFENKTYGEIPKPNEQVLLINATNLRTGRIFAFDNIEFDSIHSDLNKLPIAVAVAASAAYPGVLRAVTLKDFNKYRNLPAGSKEEEIAYSDRYVHLFDGGVSDNLALRELADVYYADIGATRPNKCLIIFVDAHIPYIDFTSDALPDRGGLLDMLLDTNALSAFSILLASKRDQWLADLGFDESHRFKTIARINEEGEEVPLPPNEIIEPYSFKQNARLRTDIDSEKGRAVDQKHQRKDVTCNLWHIALSHLLPLGWNSGMYEIFEERYDKVNRTDTEFLEFGRRLQGVPTRFKIAEQDASDLYIASELLVFEEKSKKKICSWLKELNGANCKM